MDIHHGGPCEDLGNRDAMWCRRVVVLLSGVFIFRILYLLIFPFGLSGDEAYYWDWGRMLDWGYFSKPPFIAWLMGFASWIGGDSTFALRIWAALLGTGTLFFSFLTGRLLYDARTGFWAAALLAAMPGAVLANLVLTIDAPLLFFWSAALYFFARIWVAGSSTFAGVALCASLGLGYLSKQMMLVFPALLCLFCLLRCTRGIRASFWPILAASFLFIVPTLLWNARHDWITFQHTAHHFDSNWGPLELLQNFFGFVGSQLGAVSPVFWVLMVSVGLRSLFRWRQLGDADRYVLLFSVIPLLFVLLLTLRQAVNPNWPAVFYPAGAIVVSAAFTRAGGTCLPSVRSLRTAIAVSTSLALLACSLPWVGQIPALANRGLDPFVRLQGWEDYATAIQSRRASPLPEDAFLLTVGHRYHTSQLAFHLSDQPRVYRWPTGGKIESQYEIWGGIEEAQVGRDALVIVHASDTFPAVLADSFSSMTKLEPVRIRLNELQERNYEVYWGRGFEPKEAGGRGDASTASDAPLQQ